MSQDSSWEPETNDSESFVEVDPSGRYGRYKDVIWEGAFKKVYRAFDELEGIEVAWVQVIVADFCRTNEDLERLYSEVHLLKALRHKNIIKLYDYWADTENHHLNFITEHFSSGTLRKYRKKHNRVDLIVLKKWSKQILEGLLYLHSHDPPVILRDLKCDNIMVHGNQGQLKIGDLGFATIHQKTGVAHSVIGTPEFMALELYEANYNELVDIYSFGMSMLELVTFEYPYTECTNAAQIYKKVASGIKPASLAKVKDPEVKAFIEKCIAKVPDRVTAEELLMDPFLQFNGADTNEPVPLGSEDFTVQDRKKDHNTVILKLRIEDASGHIQNIHFPFNIEDDSAVAVAKEMVQELDLTKQDVSAIAAMINIIIFSHNRDWDAKKIPENNDNADVVTTSSDEFIVSPQSVLRHLALDQLSSRKKNWSDSSKSTGGKSPSRLGLTSLSSEDSSPLVDTSKDEKELFLRCHSNDVLSVGTRPDELVVDDPMERRISDQDSAEFAVLAKKLESLLIEQQKELVELKKKHEHTVTDLLKDLSIDTREELCRIFKLKILNDELGCQI